jgi:hypothetical protein
MAIQKGTGFTNLNRVLQASRGNKLGSTISGGIKQETEGVQSKVKSAQEQFQEEANKGRLDTGEAAQKRQDILGRFTPSSGTGAVQPPQGQQPQGQQPASNAPVSDQEIQDFTKLRTGTYTGPKQLQDVQTLYGKAQQAEQLGGLARSEGGRQELLRRFVGGTGYTPGQKQLDSTLLGQQPGQLGQAAREARGSLNQVDRAAGQASGLAQEYAGRAKSFGEETQRMVGETKAPLSQGLDTRLQDIQKSEENRLKGFQSIQDILSGTGDYEGLDQWTRSGLALQAAADTGALSPSDIKMLMGQGDSIGLIQRAGNLGLDVNKLISERLTNKIAQNMSRTGVASEEDIARLNALDRLSGKTGTDLEFLQGRQGFEAGKTGFDIGSLEDYISKTEGERAASDKAYADKLASEQARYLNQAKAGIGQQIGGGMQVAGAALNDVLNPQSYYNPGTMAANLSDTISGVANVGLGGFNAANQTGNAIMEGLLKLNIGGQSIANTEGGRQLLKAIELKSKMGNLGTQAVGGHVGNISQGIKDLTSTGSWDDAFMNLSGINTLKDIGSQLRGGDVGRAATDISRSVSNAIKSIAPKGIKISDEDLKTDIDYTPEDIQRFMDRIKPAAYNYKDEVKDSPLASKNRELGVMAQDLEKSKLGKEAVHDTPNGKVVDYDNLEPKMLASIAALNKRLKELESKK